SMGTRSSGVAAGAGSAGAIPARGGPGGGGDAAAAAGGGGGTSPPPAAAPAGRALPPAAAKKPFPPPRGPPPPQPPRPTWSPGRERLESRRGEGAVLLVVVPRKVPLVGHGRALVQEMAGAAGVTRPLRSAYAAVLREPAGAGAGGAPQAQTVAVPPGRAPDER